MVLFVNGAVAVEEFYFYVHIEIFRQILREGLISFFLLEDVLFGKYCDGKGAFPDVFRLYLGYILGFLAA